MGTGMMSSVWPHAEPSSGEGSNDKLLGRSVVLETGLVVSPGRVAVERTRDIAVKTNSSVAPFCRQVQVVFSSRRYREPSDNQQG